MTEDGGIEYSRKLEVLNKTNFSMGILVIVLQLEQLIQIFLKKTIFQTKLIKNSSDASLGILVGFLLWKRRLGLPYYVG